MQDTAMEAGCRTLGTDAGVSTWPIEANGAACALSALLCNFSDKEKARVVAQRLHDGNLQRGPSRWNHFSRPQMVAYILTLLVGLSAATTAATVGRKMWSVRSDSISNQVQLEMQSPMGATAVHHSKDAPAEEEATVCNQCSCHCHWASLPGACNTNDVSCCHRCCCGQEPPPASSVNLSSGRNDSQFERLIRHEPGRLKGCLCAFDVDRTLTGKPGAGEACPANRVVAGLRDHYFRNEYLTLSPLGQGLAHTFCSRCYIGVVTSGPSGTLGEKVELRARLKGAGGLPAYWSQGSSVTSPLVENCPKHLKAACVKGVVDWYMRQGIDIKPSAVHYFDDVAVNASSFKGCGYNARQVSCASRDFEDPRVGLCGATLDEVIRQEGIFNCLHVP